MQLIDFYGVIRALMVLSEFNLVYQVCVIKANKVFSIHL